MDKISLGLNPFVIIVEHPTAVAKSAAINLVTIPPVPNEEPGESTDTNNKIEVVDVVN